MLSIVFAKAVIITLSKFRQAFTKSAIISVMLMVAVLVHFSAVNTMPRAVMRFDRLVDFEAQLAVSDHGRSTFLYKGKSRRIRFTLSSSDVRCVPLTTSGER